MLEKLSLNLMNEINHPFNWSDNTDCSHNHFNRRGPQFGIFNAVLVINCSIYIVKLPNSSLFCEQHTQYLHKGTGVTAQLPCRPRRWNWRSWHVMPLHISSELLLTLSPMATGSLCVENATRHCVCTQLNQYAELLYIAGSIRIGKRWVEISEEKIRNFLSHPDYELQQLKDFYSLWPVKTHYD
jgi:hypothetical protein